MNTFSRLPDRNPYAPKINQKRAIPNRNFAVIGVVLMFAALGSFLITQSQAATVSKAVEAESGTILGKAQGRTNQIGASGNAAVEFGVNGAGGGGDNPGGTGVDAPHNTGPNGIPGNWKIAFNDDFKGAELDKTKWIRCNPSFRAACVPWNNELQKFNDSLNNNDNFVLNNGILSIVAKKRANGEIWSGTMSTGPNKFNYAQPEYKGFQYTYGVYEGRVKFPKGKGFWPSLWQLPDQDKYGGWPSSGEYDVVEINGTNPAEPHFTVHKTGGSCGGSDCNGVKRNVGDVTTAFHTYSLDWQPDSLTWYFDGKEVHKVTGGGYVQKHPFYIIANFSMCPPGGGCWGGQTGGVDGSTPFPSSMEIDYLRVWQRQ